MVIDCSVPTPANWPTSLCRKIPGRTSLGAIASLPPPVTDPRSSPRWRLPHCSRTQQESWVAPRDGFWPRQHVQPTGRPASSPRAIYGRHDCASLCVERHSGSGSGTSQAPLRTGPRLDVAVRVVAATGSRAKSMPVPKSWNESVAAAQDLTSAGEARGAKLLVPRQNLTGTSHGSCAALGRTVLADAWRGTHAHSRVGRGAGGCRASRGPAGLPVVWSGATALGVRPVAGTWLTGRWASSPASATGKVRGVPCGPHAAPRGQPAAAARGASAILRFT